MENTASTPASAPSTRPTEPVLSLTAAAVAQVRTVCREQSFTDAYLTVRVVPSGCSGLGYDLNLIKEPKAGDLVWEQEGIKLATDAMSAQYLSGTVVDFAKTDTGEGFRFSNPNAKSSCGCGSSFNA